jgi:hypothetical protein
MRRQKLTVSVMLLTCVLNVPGSNLDWVTDYTFYSFLLSILSEATIYSFIVSRLLSNKHITRPYVVQVTDSVSKETSQ